MSFDEVILLGTFSQEILIGVVPGAKPNGLQALQFAFFGKYLRWDADWGNIDQQKSMVHLLQKELCQTLHDYSLQWDRHFKTREKINRNSRLTNVRPLPVNRRRGLRTELKPDRPEDQVNRPSQHPHPRIATLEFRLANKSGIRNFDRYTARPLLLLTRAVHE
jgi:hypothetical protein